MQKHEEYFAQLAGDIREQTTEHHTIWSLAYECTYYFFKPLSIMNASKRLQIIPKAFGPRKSRQSWPLTLPNGMIFTIFT